MARVRDNKDHRPFRSRDSHLKHSLCQVGGARNASGTFPDFGRVDAYSPATATRTSTRSIARRSHVDRSRVSSRTMTPARRFADLYNVYIYKRVRPYTAAEAEKRAGSYCEPRRAGEQLLYHWPTSTLTYVIRYAAYIRGSVVAAAAADALMSIHTAMLGPNVPHVRLAHLRPRRSRIRFARRRRRRQRRAPSRLILARALAKRILDGPVRWCEHRGTVKGGGRRMRSSGEPSERCFLRRWCARYLNCWRPSGWIGKSNRGVM